jgi:hypothetical protein
MMRYAIIAAMLAITASTVQRTAGEVLFGGPACESPDNSAERIWCAAPAAMSGRDAQRIAAAIARMHDIGGACASLAETLRAVFRAHLMRLFRPADYPGVGAAVPDPPRRRRWLLLSRDFVERFYDAKHHSANVDSHEIMRPETLQQVLAHEADHLLSLAHLDADGYLTRHTIQCSDMP